MISYFLKDFRSWTATPVLRFCMASCAEAIWPHQLRFTETACEHQWKRKISVRTDREATDSIASSNLPCLCRGLWWFFKAIKKIPAGPLYGVPSVFESVARIFRTALMPGSGNETVDVMAISVQSWDHSAHFEVTSCCGSCEALWNKLNWWKLSDDMWYVCI